MKAVSWLLVLAAFAARAESPDDFRFAMPVSPAGEEGLQRIELPLEVYRGAARADMADLRLFDGRGERLPFAFAGVPAPEPSPAANTALPLFPIRGEQSAGSADLALRVKRSPDGTIVELRTLAPARTAPVVAWIADATVLRDPLRSVRLSWSPPAGGFVARMRVEASDDLASWHGVVADAPLVELVHEGSRLKRDTIEVPALRAKYLRFTWLGQAPPLAAVVAETVAAAAERKLRTLTADGTTGERPGELVFALTARVPVERLHVQLPQANSVVPVRIDSRDDPKSEWRPVASLTVYRLRRDATEVVSPPIAFPARPDRFWRVTADARSGGFGAGTVGLEAGWLPRQVVFAARGEGPFVLAFGNAQAQAIAYPVTTLVPDYRAHDEFTLPVARLGTLSENAARSASRWPDWLREADGKRITLWALLLAGVAVLAAMAWRLSRQVQSPPRGAEPPKGA